MNKRNHDEKKGIINPKIVRILSFAIISISLIICIVLCILAIWDFTKSDAIWRAIATFGVISVGSIVFTFANEKLG